MATINDVNRAIVRHPDLRGLGVVATPARELLVVGGHSALWKQNNLGPADDMFAVSTAEMVERVRDLQLWNEHLEGVPVMAIQPGPGESVEVQGSAAKPYIITNHGFSSWSCTCPAWKNQKIPGERRTCKHIKQVRGITAERDRLAGVPQDERVTKNGLEDAFSFIDS